MLIDTGLTLAYKCSSCGTFEFFNISLFKLLYKKESILTCRCNKSSITINEENSKDYKIIIPCISCGNKHAFIISRKNLLFKDVNILYCPETGMQQCFIGSDEEVRKKIDHLEKELDELINLFGYDNYFNNTQVMFDALNKIHDIAEAGNLFCECGNHDIELIMLSDKIQLRCKRCPGKKIIQAASNKDLKDILSKQQLLLISSFVIPGEPSLVSKTDEK